MKHNICTSIVLYSSQRCQTAYSLRASLHRIVLGVSLPYKLLQASWNINLALTASSQLQQMLLFPLNSKVWIIWNRSCSFEEVNEGNEDIRWASLLKWLDRTIFLLFLLTTSVSELNLLSREFLFLFFLNVERKNPQNNSLSLSGIINMLKWREKKIKSKMFQMLKLQELDNFQNTKRQTILSPSIRHFFKLANEYTAVTVIYDKKRSRKNGFMIAQIIWILYRTSAKNLQDTMADTAHWFKLLQDSDLVNILLCKNTL